MLIELKPSNKKLYGNKFAELLGLRYRSWIFSQFTGRYPSRLIDTATLNGVGSRNWVHAAVAQMRTPIVKRAIISRPPHKQRAPVSEGFYLRTVLRHRGFSAPLPYLNR